MPTSCVVLLCIFLDVCRGLKNSALLPPCDECLGRRVFFRQDLVIHRVAISPTLSLAPYLRRPCELDPLSLLNHTRFSLYLQDLKEAQPAVGRGLQQLLDFDGDVEATFSRTFQISYEVRLSMYLCSMFFCCVELCLCSSCGLVARDLEWLLVESAFLCFF